MADLIYANGKLATGIAKLACNVLNRMGNLGKPASCAIRR